MKYRSLSRLGDCYLDIASNDAVSAAVSVALARIASLASLLLNASRKLGDRQTWAVRFREKQEA